MLEVYVLLTLGALGYLLNKSDAKITKSTKDVVNRNEIPSMRNAYESTYTRTADQTVQQKATKKYQQAEDPMKTAVISNNYHFMKEGDTAKKQEEMVKSLTGDFVDRKDFTHNNMVPFYGGRIRQNMDDHSNRTLLENFTGVTDMHKSKCEVGSLGDLKRDVGNVTGMQSYDDFYKDRMVQPTVRNNEFPIPQMHVGPGVGQGYTSEPTGGYQQFDIQQYAQDKCVDELRTKLNPAKDAIGAADRSKQTYASRTVDGLKTGLRGETGEVSKNRVDTFFEQTPDMWLKTTAATLKPSKTGEFNVKETNRLTTTKEHMGSAYASGNLARTTDPSVQPSSRVQLRTPEFGVAAMDRYGKGERDDYGKSKILVYNNERDLTTTKVYQGNLTSLVKSIIAPIEDMIKITKKQHHVDNPRHFGNINIQIPDKMRVYDPNDVARTTIKETLIHDAILGNLKGAEKLTVHDPNDATRTTVKETTIHDAILGNLKGSDKLTVYDPNDVARTTIKETLIHDEVGAGSVTGPKQIYVYDPDKIAKKTIRETLERMDYEMNMATQAVRKGIVYDPDDVANTTIKETTVDKERLYGNINAKEGGGGYETNEFDARTTQKQFVSDHDYIGVVARDKGEGYITNEYDAKDTQKQFLSDYEYFGVAEAGSDKKQKSYDDMYNATITEKKEVTLFGREPTQTSSKVFNDCVNVAVPKKRECDLKMERDVVNRERASNVPAPIDEYGVTRVKKSYDQEQDTRLDPGLLKAFLENPFTQPLNSVA